VIDDYFEQPYDQDEPDPLASDADHASPFSVAVATVAGMTGIKALRGAWRRRHDDAPSAIAEPPPVPAASPAPPAPSPAQPASRPPGSGDRETLVELCIELDDLLTDEALREKLRRGLRRVGVEAVEPAGARFDPEVHCAVGTAAAGDAADDRLIARVERAGFSDHGLEVRPPEVVVYRREPDGRNG